MLRCKRGAGRLGALLGLSLASMGCGEDGATSGAGGAGASSASGGAAGPGASGAGAGGGAVGASSSGSGGSTSSGGGGGSGGGAPTNNGFPDHWIDGLACSSDPDIQVWQYDEHTFILRQSLCTNFEGPFFYLLFGEDKAFLQDTGTGDVNLQQKVAEIVEQWLSTNGKPSIELVVTHSHGHGDHVGGDSQFQGKPSTTVVPTSAAGVQSFFGITQWPTEIAELDLGGRVLDIIPIPGHQSAHIAVYDRAQDLLLTGDTLYPGRLYISDWDQYRESIPRLVSFVNAGNPVAWVLGTHIEMTTTAGDDYPMGSTKHASEHALQLGLDVLLELDQAVSAMGDAPTNEVHDDFIVYPL